MNSLLLSCTGLQNIVIIKKSIADDGLDLFLNGDYCERLRFADATRQPPLLAINQIIDAGFDDDGAACWRYDDSQDHGASLGLDMSERWTLHNGHTLHVHQRADVNVAVDLVYHDPVVGEFLPVTGGDYYQLAGSFGIHRCHGFLVAEFYDQQRKLLLSHNSPMLQGKKGGFVLEDYQTVSYSVQAPKNAALVRLLVRKHPANEDGADSFLFLTRPFFGQVPNASSALPWAKSPGSKAHWQLLRKTKLADYVAVRFALPSKAYDGQQHQITLVEPASGDKAHGSPSLFFYQTDISGGLLALDGIRVLGWVSEPETQVDLFIDDQWVADGVSAKAADNQQHRYSIALPQHWLDGRPHRLQAKLHLCGKQIGELAEIIPYVLTPWDVLQKYAGKPLPAKLSPAAAYRYEALRASLLALSRAAAQKTGQDMDDLIAHVSQLGVLHEILLTGFEHLRRFVPLVFPSPAQPKVSIVVPVHNKFAVTYNCLAALLFAYNQASFEVIVVDDGSSDETLNLQHWVSGIVCLRNETSQGFIRSCNRGASVAGGEYIVMLNNDTEPTAYWLDELLFCFEQFHRVGLAGSKLLYPDGRLQEAGGIVWSSGNPWNYGRGANPNDPRFNYTRQADYLSGAAIMLAKTVWDEVGGFSDDYCPAYFEDTDLAFKVRAAGYKTVYAPLSVVYHFEGVSSGTDVASGTKRYQEINRPKFKQKWIHHCRHHGDEGKDVDLNKDRGITMRALVIDYQTPRPDIDAGSYAAVQEMRLLQALGFKITFVADNFAYLGQYTESLQRLGIEVLYAPFVFNMQALLQQRGPEFDVVYITRYYVAKNHLPLVRQYAVRAKVLFCNADLHFLRELREAIAHNDRDQVVRACAIRDEELAIMREVDVALSYNPIEHAVILSHNLEQAKKVATCPWVVDVIEGSPGFCGRADIAFLGGFGHPPNKAAVLFFIQQVMPILRQQLPEAKFRVYGSNVPDDIKKLQSDDVIIEGYIEDVAGVYDRCRVFVAPLLTGAGIKGKVIEALAYGTPTVLSAIAAEGIPLRHGLEVLIADSAQDWAEAVTRLYTEQTLWEQLHTAAKEFARLHYNFADGQRLMRKALETADIFAPLDNQALVAKHARPSAVR